MINQTLLWLLLIPVCLGIVLYALRRAHQDSWMLCGAYVAAGLFITCALFFIAKSHKTGDTELWNGQVVSKERIHDDYVRRYECNCVSHRNSDGTTYKTCQTCTEDHYTVEWKVNTTIGTFEIQKLDWTNQKVYKQPDPPRYTIVEKGEPVAKKMPYVNYIQAVPNSLFDPAAATIKEKFKAMLPAYPDNVYDFYHVDRFVGVGWAPADAALWNRDISLGLREIGPRKQVNLIIVVAKTNDPLYEYALRDHWEGANKNDVVVLIGSTEYPKIDFVRVISWTKSELFKVQLRDTIEAKGTIDRGIVKVCLDQIDTNFERRRMREFSYLDGEIDPPDWLVYTIIGLLIGGAVFAWWRIPVWCAGRGPFRRRYR